MIPFYLVSAVYAVGLGNVLYFALSQAYSIRMVAIEEYGRVVHEFDPYFNYRATEYLWQHGWYSFRTWFDHESWYPLGRPVGTTIYPGMQVTSVLIKKYLLPEWSINDICCFVPVWFGVLATLATALLAYECSVGVHTTKNTTTTTNTVVVEKKKEQETAWFGVLATLATALLAYECSVGVHTTKKKSTTTTSVVVVEEEEGAGNSNKTNNNTNNDPQEFSSILNSIPIVKQIYQATIVPLWKNFIVNKWIELTGAPYGLMGVYEQTTTNNNGSTTTTVNSTPALEAAVITALCMSMVPAHLMRSVGGGYDNESVAVFAMTFTFYCWTRSLRGNDTPNYVWSVLSGLAYFNMVAAWGGYVFVLNLIGVHASVLVLMGRYSKKLYVSYTLFYSIGTVLAIQVPVVGWTPLKSLEQMGPLLAFGIFQLLELCQVILRAKKRTNKNNNKKNGSTNKSNKKSNNKKTFMNSIIIDNDWLMVHLQVFGTAAALALVIAFVLNGRGYFGPISSRVRGLFVKHTKTGNPLVDSVAEHQPANAGAYEQYLTKHVVLLCPVGFAYVAFCQFHDSSSFLVVYGLAAYFFSNKMVRLILLTAPIASVLVGITLSHVWCWGVTALLGRRPSLQPFLMGSSTSETTTTTATTTPTITKSSKKGKKKGAKEEDDDDDDDVLNKTSHASSTTTASSSSKPVVYNENYLVRIVRLVLFGYCILFQHKDRATDFFNTCHELSRHLSHPTIIQKGQNRQTGEIVLMDDYRQAYWWLRDNTPQDSRILAWWDYGYQIAGIA
eukprot:CAMPEP_0194229208 /NCGR_PEP_ID=MMETSP0156-20130528/43769_1 /TAXON_ID=33649 /ORGANISM="Thalassionema nitzschioides, Strain L26-B" /LENGTH=781 /DNA_ID=CAMNT_0038961751 /DNA_START=290 /DNA_END=2633 /DNA_ORIENTATION=-